MTNKANISFQFFPTAEGYVNVLNKEEDDGGFFKHLFDYVYNYTDHLGNIRLSYTDANRDGKIGNYIDFSNGYQQVKEILEENNYYPFGLKHKNYNSLISKYALTTSSRKPVAALNSETGYKYKYNGQEWQDELGLNWYTYRHRNYNPAIGRFFGVDPISENFYNISTYQFAHNNPAWKIELEGLEGEETSGFDLQAVAGNAWSWTKGFVNTVADNITGTTNLRGTFDDGSSAYNSGRKNGHTATFVGSAFLAADGAANISAGGTGLVASGVAASTGVGTPAGGVGAAVSGTAIAKGTAEVAVGVWIGSNTMMNMAEDKNNSSNSNNSSGARTNPKDLKEKLTLDEAKSGKGEEIMKGKLKNSKYDSKTGTHDKIKHNHDHGDGTSTEIHYDRNRKTGEGSGYKIKDDTNAKSRGHRYP